MGQADLRHERLVWDPSMLPIITWDDMTRLKSTSYMDGQHSARRELTSLQSRHMGNSLTRIARFQI